LVEQHILSPIFSVGFLFKNILKNGGSEEIELLRDTEAVGANPTKAKNSLVVKFSRHAVLMYSLQFFSTNFTTLVVT
jgi:hypothetical protein